MIVWLASYPRSGNTLLRTILFKSFGLGSYSEYSMGDAVEVKSPPAHLDGVFLHYPQGWRRFLSEEAESPWPLPVKTHGAPMDRQKAIYVVRDGRQVLLSYWRFHAKHHSAAGITLAELIGGVDHYGDWSGHYRAWVDGRRDLLVLKYEDLVEADMATLRRIADFIGHVGEIRPWVNAYRKVLPDAQGDRIDPRTEWKGDEAWTPVVDAIFWHLHGGLMRELGYGEREEPTADRYVPEGMDQLAISFGRMAGEIGHMRRQLLDKQQEIELLTGVCEERANLIRQLDDRLKQ